MSCKSCAPDKWTTGVCRCCQLVDRDTRPKLIAFCSVCGVFLCKSCYRDKPKRILAFGKAMFEDVKQIGINLIRTIIR